MTTEPKWNHRKPVLIGALATILLLGGVGAWGTQVRIAGAVIGQGRVEVDTTKQVIQHPTGGVVAEILVSNGDLVEAGDVVVRFDGFALRTQLNTVEGELFEVLAKGARLEAEIDERHAMTIGGLLAARADSDPAARATIERQQRLLDASFVTLDQKSGLVREKIAQVRSQIDAVEAQVVAKDDQIALVDEDLVKANKLAEQGLIKGSQVSDLRKERARLIGEKGSLAANMAELNQKTVELELELLGLPVERRSLAVEELSKLQPLKVKLTESRAEITEQLEQLEVRTPVSGIIHDSQVHGLRSVVVEATPIMYVVPTERPAIAVVRVDARDIDQVHAGQEGSLRFSAFHRRATPIITGEVITVSPDAYVDPVTRSYYYEARIAIPDAALEELGGNPLVPGMPVEVFFATEEQTPLTYVTKPLVGYFNRAYRDT
jgi:HlyD family secretion protein